MCSAHCSRLYECYTSIIGTGGGLIPLSQPCMTLKTAAAGEGPVADAQLFSTRILGSLESKNAEAIASGVV